MPVNPSNTPLCTLLPYELGGKLRLLMLGALFKDTQGLQVPNTADPVLTAELRGAQSCSRSLPCRLGLTTLRCGMQGSYSRTSLSITCETKKHSPRAKEG